MYHVTLTEEQLVILCQALDNYARMGTGQLDVAVEEFARLNFYDLYYEKPSPEPGVTNGDLVRRLVGKIKCLVWDHSPTSAWSIFHRQVPAKCREAYDMYQVLRKARAEHRLATAENEKAKRRIHITVCMDPYMPANPDLPPISVVWVD